MDALPNVHAAVLHFPLVLVPLAVCGEALGLVLNKNPSVERLAATFWGLAAVSACVTYLAGRDAADGLVDVPASAQLALSGHADAAWLLLIGVVVLAVSRIASLFAAPAVRLLVRGGSVGFGALLLFQLVATADRGGALVYRHGLAVHQPDAPECETAALPTSIGGWHLDVDGTAVWEPRPGDLANSDVVSVLTGRVEEVSGGDGFQVRAEGPSLLVFPGTWADVQINMTVGLTGFQGTLGLVHHVAAPSAFDMFSVSNTGRASLIRVRDADTTVLHEAAWDPSEDAILSVSSAESHLKGLVAGAMVNHGHATAAPAGRVGLYVDGTGIITLRRVEVVPLMAAD